MFASRAKVEDMKLRVQYMELTEMSLMRSDHDSAKFFGQMSNKLKQRIDTHDYSEEDLSYEAVDKIEKEFADLSTVDAMKKA